MNVRFHRRLLSALLAASLAAAAAGCAQEQTLKNPLGEIGEGELTLRVAAGDPSYFYERYGNAFMADYPRIELDVVPLEENLGEQLDQHPPDVVELGLPQYGAMAEAGKLHSLERAIAEDRYDTEGIYPAVLDLLKNASGGTLYGLAPEFVGKALYYNRTTFDRLGLDPPQDRASWEEVLSLAQLFGESEGGDRVYGLALEGAGTFTAWLTAAGGAEGLRYVTADYRTVTFDTEGWRRIYAAALEAMRSGSLYLPSSGDARTVAMDYYVNDVFSTGKAAMMVAGPYLMDRLAESEMEWGVVAAPVGSTDRNRGPAIELPAVYAIPANASNLAAAWELVKFINGEQSAKSNASIAGGALQSRTAYNGDRGGRSLEPFVRLEPAEPPRPPSGTERQEAFDALFAALAERESGKVIRGESTVERAMAVIQSEGQTELDRLNAD